MASDTSYTTFLTRANEDPNSGTRPDQPTTSTSQSRTTYDPTTSPSSPSSALPPSLRTLPDTPYISETDSAWEAVFFNYAGDTAPSVDEFKQVLRAAKGVGEHGGRDVTVEELSVREFDPRGEYTEVVGRVREAGEKGESRKRGGVGEGDGDGKGDDVKVFRVESGKTRCEYYVLTVGERKLVGVVAKAVES